jgi:RHS repeat-associated protein
MNKQQWLLAAILLLIASFASAQTVEYIHTDALGSPVAVTNASGAVLERTVYEPYGAVTNRPLTNGPGYTGHVADAVTGLNYMQQRYYDPALRKFLSIDPVTADTVTGWNFNRYNYAANNPYKFKDPDGRIIDTIADIGFIAYDIYALATDPSWTNAAALGADIVGAAVPFATGLGAGVRAGVHGAEAIRGADKAADTAKAVHGNSAASTKAQHRYEISDKATGDVKKTGISGGKLNKDGSSRRANSQVNKLNKTTGSEKYGSSVKETGIPGRGAGLDAERAATADLKSQGHSLEFQCRPDPNGGC